MDVRAERGRGLFLHRALGEEVSGLVAEQAGSTPAGGFQHSPHTYLEVRRAQAHGYPRGHHGDRRIRHSTSFSYVGPRL
jgi:hypothetical protein